MEDQIKEMVKGLTDGLSGLGNALEKAKSIDEKLREDIGPKYDLYRQKYATLYNEGKFDECEKLKKAFINGE